MRRSLMGGLALLAVLGAWLWPIGFGGRMPVGGDVTAFSFGLMARYDQALAEGSWPWWVPEWGFGFPGVAESQMGVYYPPHLLLYGFLPAEWAYTSSLVIHLAWGMVGAVWAGRRFGVSEGSSWLVGICWGLQGFLLVHLPHHWSYTVASWLPWAWGLAWRTLTANRPWSSAFWLAIVLAIQVLPGHFQLAFVTQGGVCFLAIGWLVRKGAGWRVLSRSGWLVLAGVLAIGLSAGQWVPTWRLARLSEQERSFEYLSGFAGTPLHLVNYVAPLLFHRSPLWRPIAWDPFHTSPEEWQPYVGLVPLLLAVGAVGAGWRTRLEIRALAVVAGAMVVLSLGPYVPGFEVFCQWPGFSFFRAPGRWSLGTGTALSLLCGHGLDLLRQGEWSRPRRALGGMTLLAIAWTAGVVGIFEGLLAEHPVGGPITAAADRLMARLPWGEGMGGRVLAERAMRPVDDVRVQSGYAREGWGRLPRGGQRFEVDRPRTYRAELAGTVGLSVGILGLVLVVRDRKKLAIGLGLLTAADLVGHGRFKGVESAPLRPLVEQSSVLARLGLLPRGSRVVDPMQNLSMAAGVAPVLAYRTLDLPVPVEIVQELRDPRSLDLRAPEAGPDSMRKVGAAARVFGPGELPEGPRRELGGEWEEIDDPVLAGWMYGSGWVQAYGPAARRFVVWFPPGRATMAWVVTKSDEASGNEVDWRQARPAEIRWEGMALFEVSARLKEKELVVVAEVFDPQWVVRPGPGGETTVNPKLRPVMGGWLQVEATSPGELRALFRYEPVAEILGLEVSVLSLLFLVSAIVAARLFRRRRGAGAATSLGMSRGGSSG